MKKLLFLLLISTLPLAVAQEESDIPPEIQALEESFNEEDQSAEFESAPDSATDLARDNQAPKISEPGEDLPPSMMLYRVPLLPAMSEANWKKYAAPVYSRVYRTKKGDSLWLISERLFGNPHLWPKIWQLNANVANPHVITRGMELMFTPGNPNASPHLAFKKFGDRSDDYLPPLTGHGAKFSVADKIRDALMKDESGFGQFRSFLVRSKPEIVGKLPKESRANYRLLFEEGSQFAMPLTPPGDYAIVRLREPPVKDLGGTIVWWIGNIQVRDPLSSEDRNAVVTKAFESISPGDLIAVRNFAMSPLAVHSETLGPGRRKEVKFVNVDSNLLTLSGEGFLMGARFQNDAAGPSLGGIVNVMREKEQVATAVLIDRDRDLGTFWFVESKQEVLDSDYVE